MSDIVERLNRYVESIQVKNDLKVGPHMCADAMDEAAQAITALTAEIERLREALERISSSNLTDMNTLHPDSCPRVAAAALKGKS